MLPAGTSDMPFMAFRLKARVFSQHLQQISISMSNHKNSSIFVFLQHWHKHKQTMESGKGGYIRRRLCGGHKVRRQATEQRWRWCEAIKKGRVCFVCLWCTHQGVITRQYCSDELRAVISLLRLHSASRSVSTIMLLSTPTSHTINAAARTADIITHGNALIPAPGHAELPAGKCPAKLIEHLQGLAFIKMSRREREMLTLMLLACHFHAF